MIDYLRATLSYWRARRHWKEVRNLPIHREYDRAQAIFIHIPKTAGLSVAHALFNGQQSQHRTADQMRIIFGNRDFKRYFTFTFVRHPLDRFLSAFFFLADGGISENDRDVCRRYRLDSISGTAFLDLFKSDAELRNYLHFEPQWPYCLASNGTQKVDFIGRFENLQNDFQYVARRMNRNVSLPRKNVGPQHREKPAPFFSEPELRWIRQYYEMDFRLLNYDPSSASNGR